MAMQIDYRGDDRVKFSGAWAQWFDRRVREEGISQPKLARYFEVSENTIRSWRRGTVPDGYNLALAFALLGKPDGELEGWFTRVFPKGRSGIYAA